MPSEFDSAPPEPKDRTKLIWLSIVILIALMIGAIWSFGGQDNSGVSRVRIRHILITYSAADAMDRARAIKEAKELLARVRNGEDFGKLAQEYSNDDTTAHQGGDLGWSVMKTYEPSIESYIWSAPPNTPSDVLQTKYGYHIVEVTDRVISPADAYMLNIKLKEEGGAESATGS